MTRIIATAIGATLLLVGLIFQTTEASRAKTQLFEIQRQIEAARTARDNYRDALADAQAGALVRQSELEKEIADYETLLDQDGRSCRLDARDLEWLHE